MMSGLVQIALQQRLIVFIGAIALAVWGTVAYQKLSIDAFPDVAPIQVLVSMQAPGLTPEELESRVTTPIERLRAAFRTLCACDPRHATRSRC